MIPIADHILFAGVFRSEIIDTWGVTMFVGLVGSRYGMANASGLSRILKRTIIKQIIGTRTKKVEPTI